MRYCLLWAYHAEEEHRGCNFCTLTYALKTCSMSSPRAISVDSPPKASIYVSDGRLFTLTARKSHPAMIHSNRFAAVSSNAIGWWDPASCCIFCCSFWTIVVFDSFCASEWYYKAEQARNKFTSGLAMMPLHDLVERLQVYPVRKSCTPEAG